MKKTQSKGFTLIEVLIVITIIGVLAALAANALGAFGGAKSRDAVRIANLQQASTIIASVQNRFHVPPLSSVKSKYPTDCQGSDASMLGKCLKKLKVTSDQELYDMLSDPKYGAEIADGTSFTYKYAASSDGFKLCAYLEDQGAFEQLNANTSGVVGESDENADTNMHCVVNGKNINDVTAEAVAIDELVSKN